MKKMLLMLGCLGVFSGAHGTDVSFFEAFNQKSDSMKNQKRPSPLKDIKKVSGLKKIRGAESMLKNNLIHQGEEEREKLETKFFFDIRSIISSSQEYDLQKNEQTFAFLIFNLCNVIKIVKNSKNFEKQESWPHNLLAAIGMVCACYPTECLKIKEDQKELMGLSSLRDAKNLKSYGLSLLLKYKDCDESFANCYDYLEEEH